MGGKLGTLFARAGMRWFSATRAARRSSSGSREEIAGDNALAGTPAEAARARTRSSWPCTGLEFPDVLQQAGDISGKIIVSCSLPMNADNTELVVAHTSSAWRSLQRSSRRRES